jgi:tetratricopeptide (TPR) repeat protein
MQGRFKDNPAYVEYETLLKRLHRLIAEGQGDSEAADQVREQMDAPEARLNRWEINRLNGLSADLYMLQQAEVLQEPPVARDQEELHQQIQEYERWNDWDSVLAVLRRRPALVLEEAVAFTRARAYGALGHDDTALLFFEHGMKRGAASPDLRAMHLSMLQRAGQLQQAIELGSQYADAPSATPEVQIANAVNRFEILGNAEAPQVLTLLSRALERIGPKYPTSRSYVVLAYLLAAQCLMLLGTPADAVAAIDEALKIRPGDVGIQQARDVILTSHEADLSESFKRATANLRLAIYGEGQRTVTSAHTVWGKAA